MIKKTCTDSLPLKKPHTATKMKYNINMDSAITR
jgi:hypothetical protein